MILFSTLLFSLFITMALIPILRRYAVHLNCVDMPCERKVHETAMPRVGGLAMAVGALVPMLLWAYEDRLATAILIGAAVIVIFGFLDDARDLKYMSKFGAQLAAALSVVLIGDLKIFSLGGLLPEYCILPDYLAIPFTLLVIVGVTNAVNLADGLDGLAGGIMMLSFLCIGFVAYQVELFSIALLAIAVVGAIFGFLRYNTYPASIFMGDAGSQMLGFLAVIMAIALTQSGTALSPAFPLLLLGLPVMDTISVMIERFVNGQPLFQPDKKHLHHRLLSLNLYHREAVIVIYVLQTCMVTAAFLLRFQSEWMLLTGYLALCGAVMSLLTVAEKKGWRLERPSSFDRLVKHRLKVHIKDRFLFVKVFQWALEKGLLLVLLATFAVPARIPRAMGVAALVLLLVLALVLVFTRLLRPVRVDVLLVLRAVIYFIMPLLIYYGERQPFDWIPDKFMLAYDISFGLLVFSAILLIKITRRQKGYIITPLDFIILFLAVVAPNLPDAALSKMQLGAITAKIVALFFSFEVLAGELRGQLNRVSLAAMLGLLFAFGRWVI